MIDYIIDFFGMVWDWIVDTVTETWDSLRRMSGEFNTTAFAISILMWAGLSALLWFGAKNVKHDIVKTWIGWTIAAFLPISYMMAKAMLDRER